MSPAVVSRLGRALRRRRAGWSYADDPRLAAPTTIALASPAFVDGGAIPLRHSGEGRGENVSPALAWTGVPGGTVQLLLVMEDTDVPLPRPIVHMVAVLDPGVTARGEFRGGQPGSSGGVPEGGLHAGSPAPGVQLLPGSRGRVGYHGPRPMPGHGPHHYCFHLYALDARLPDEPAPAHLRDLLPLVDGHVLASGHLVGVQERP